MPLETHSAHPAAKEGKTLSTGGGGGCYACTPAQMAQECISETIAIIPSLIIPHIQHATVFLCSCCVVHSSSALYVPSGMSMSVTAFLQRVTPRRRKKKQRAAPSLQHVGQGKSATFHLIAP